MFSPDGRQLSFTVDGQLRLVSLTLSPEGAVLGTVQTPFEDMGGIGDVAWSPAGDVLAFVSNRSTHAFIGIYRLGDDRVRWLSPAIASDASPSWAPDGKRIAFMRYPARSYNDVPDVIPDRRFEIRIADVSTGESRSIYRSPGADAGAQRGLPPRWLKDGRIAFLSDEDGFSHLYAVDPVDRRVAQLSHGSCDLETFDVDADGEAIAVSGNCFDRFRRDVALWTPADGQLRRVSAPQAIASDAIFIGSGHALLYRSATFNRPQMPALQRPGHAEQLLTDSAAAETIEALQEPRVVQFNAPDGTHLSGVLFAARGSKPGERAPAVVYTHGGPNRQMLPGWYPTSYYAYAYAANQQLALHGITVLAVNYRTGTGFGRAFRTAAGYGPHGALELQDVFAAADYLKALPLVDRSRIGIYGGSFGGHLAANALARRSDEFKAGVAWHGIYDFTQWIVGENHPNRLPTLWGASETGRNLAYESSALAHVSTWRAPTLLIAGDDDRHVDFAETVALREALEGAGNPVETLVLPNEIHGFLRHASWLDVISHTNAFLIGHLQ
jgi:dipeptidyl aminopeptidase/acylaminoacyl peptidase